MRLTSTGTRECGECKGKGWVPCPKTIAVRTGVNGFNARGAVMLPSDGHPIPCPVCKGKKVVLGDAE
jgi:hypothetical protein